MKPSQTTQFEALQATSALYCSNAEYLENLYEQYLTEPTELDSTWNQRFSKILQINQSQFDQSKTTLSKEVKEDSYHLIRKKLQLLTANKSTTSNRIPNPNSLNLNTTAGQQAAVLRLINSYRYRGHQIAALDPLNLAQLPEIPDLDPAFYQLTDRDLEQVFHTGSLYAADYMKLKDIIALCQEVYCRHLGFEYMHITDTVQKRWIQKRIESYRGQPVMTDRGKRWILTLLTAAEGLEKYLHTRYVGQKRFSLEGAEALIPLLDELIQRAGRHEVQEIVIGMAHRGRLNVLTNILGKPPNEIFREFESQTISNKQDVAGDVKYHLGFSCDLDTDGGVVHLALGFNPSHLEIISPVVEGSVRARQRRRGDTTGSKVIPVLIHGDAAFAGQGVVMETLQLSKTRGFSTGGTIHIIVNNQIGFTISHPLDSRSTTYCTDVAKMIQTPIIHVNGDAPEAVIFAVRLALDYRMQFHADVILDMVCYRRHGHNEADEPAVTQPLMYQTIRKHPTTRHLYAKQLITENLITPDDAQQMLEQYQNSIESGIVKARPVFCTLTNPYRVDWEPFKATVWEHKTDTSLPKTQLQTLAQHLLELPPEFQIHPRVNKIWNERKMMAVDKQLVDWGFAETLAYATLLEAGYPVRLSGQDSGRGTFFHRHATVYDQKTGSTWIPLQHLSSKQAPFTIIDSILSEEAVLAFEYGHASAEPNVLTLWEAQFGDFANVAQVVIDQFITSGGTKWGLLCGLTMLLPHGYEGQGAEHSSARLERFLQACAGHNIQICVPTTPAQMYHLLRRQMLRPYRRPLIVFTPKSLLRHRLATSTLDELATGSFQPLIQENALFDVEQITRVLICTGKIYYNLLETRRTQAIEHVAILRLEQLYPFPTQQVITAIAKFPKAQELIWCQEEPQNQGAWDQIKHRLNDLLKSGQQLYYVGRPVSAAPAVGNYQVHIKQQEQIVDTALLGQVDVAKNKLILQR
ncbi:2-oxoglutarate dehydrogenase [Achromatium sp. WMS3]|nr:2-oxoglutarate dehydrogenase [Achromatium sp. WMS3]